MHGKHKSAVSNFTRGLPSVRNGHPTPVIASAIKVKRAKYSVLNKLLGLQASLYTVAKKCDFVVAAISHRGEMSGELIDFIEDVTMKFKYEERKRYNVDGLTALQATTAFRSDFKLRIYTSLVRGWGTQLGTPGTY